jgi:hypothetical protein
MLWPQANVKALTHPSAVAREFPPQRVPKGGISLTLGTQIDGRVHGPKESAKNRDPFIDGAGGSQPPREESRLVGGAQEKVASQPWHHTLPHPFNRPGDLGSQEALQLKGCVTLGGCCSSQGPSLPTTYNRKWL